MLVTPLSRRLLEPVERLMQRGAPYVRARTPSDYWLYAELFSSTCPVVLVDDEVAGAAIAFRSQNDPSQIYVQDLMTSPDHRRRGVAGALLGAVCEQAIRWKVHRVYLTSEPDNIPARTAWDRAGFVNAPGDFMIDGVWLVRDLKGPGRHRAVYERRFSDGASA